MGLVQSVADLQLNDDLALHDDVGKISANQMSTVVNLERDFVCSLKAAVREFTEHGLFVDGFSEAMTERAVNGEGCADDTLGQPIQCGAQAHLHP